MASTDKMINARGFDKLIALERQQMAVKAQSVAKAARISYSNYVASGYVNGIPTHVFRVKGVIVRLTEGV